MEDPGHDRLLIQLQIRQDDGNTKGVNDIRFTRLARLALVGLPRQLIRFFHHGNIVGGVVLPDTLDQVLVQHLRAGKIRRVLQFYVHVFLHSFLCHKHATFFCA